MITYQFQLPVGLAVADSKPSGWAPVLKREVHKCEVVINDLDRAYLYN